LNDWKRVTEMLRAYRDQQRSTWGDTDDVLVAKYLSNVCNSQEQAVVERACAERPAAWGELVQVLREIAAAPLPPIETSVLHTEPGTVRIWDDMAAPVIRLAERLSAWLDRAGTLAANGLRSVLATPQFATAGAMGSADVESEAGKAIWSIPLPDGAGKLTLFVGPGESPDEWALLLKLDLAGDAQLPDHARLEIRNGKGRQELSGPLGDYLKKAITLTTGSWRMTLEIGPRSLLIPMDLGPPDAGG
jgi:hypothetical protein